SAAINRKQRNAYPACSDGIAAYGFGSISFETEIEWYPCAPEGLGAGLCGIRISPGSRPFSPAAHGGADGESRNVMAPAKESVMIVAAKREKSARRFTQRMNGSSGGTMKCSRMTASTRWSYHCCAPSQSHCCSDSEGTTPPNSNLSAFSCGR